MNIVDELSVNLTLQGFEKIQLFLRPLTNNSLFIIDEIEAKNTGEAVHQLKEGFSYDYKITDGYELKSIAGVITANKFNPSQGRISPGNYVGRLSLSIKKISNLSVVGEIKLEVRSSKASYRDDYRMMLNDIAEKCIDLIYQYTSPVTQLIESDHSQLSTNGFQRFSFIQNILTSTEFDETISKIINSPISKLIGVHSRKDVRSVRKFSSNELKQIGSSKNRIFIPDNYINNQLEINSFPSHISVSTKQDSVDTHENRFVKYVLEDFLEFVQKISKSVEDDSKIFHEATFLINKLEEVLHTSLFKSVGKAVALHLNSPVLQRKEGYRDLLKNWLMFNLAAKLIWSGVQDSYDVNKRDVATLYEYWCFFKLLEIIERVFGVNSSNQLFTVVDDFFGLQLNRGKWKAIDGISNKYDKKINIQFSFNRTFSGDAKYPSGGSWTKSMRPDFTLTVWPIGLTQSKAEIEEKIIHIHFDAKYKIDFINSFYDQEILGSDINIEENKSPENFKREDLLKMHAYKDAIRRTYGSYILYPGLDVNGYVKNEFNEILPGLGAFTLKPKPLDSGEEFLERFLIDIGEHFFVSDAFNFNSTAKYFNRHLS